MAFGSHGCKRSVLELQEGRPVKITVSAAKIIDCPQLAADIESIEINNQLPGSGLLGFEG